MDVFYYWRKMTEDLKNGRVGRFRSAKERLEELHAGAPDYIWAFKTPTGKKGHIQLLARLVWSDTRTTKFAESTSESYIHYEPYNKRSVWFEGTDTDEAITEATEWLLTHIPIAVASNFQGINGQHPLRGPCLGDLNRLARRYATRPFLLRPEG